MSWDRVSRKWGMLTKLVIVMLVLSILIATPPSPLARSWSILSDPDPPPTGTVGKHYSVTFSVEPAFESDWTCEPSNPVPGLSFSDMTQVRKITLSGTPKRAGTYKFTLRVYYKEELRAQRTFTIKIVGAGPKPYDIYMLQILPSTVERRMLIPSSIYLGQEVLIVFYTNNAHPGSIQWKGLYPPPGTSFDVERKGSIISSLPQNVQAAASYAMRNIGQSDPLLTLRGRPNKTGTYKIIVKAVDKYGQEKVKAFNIEVLEHACTLWIIPSPHVVSWNVTSMIFEHDSQLYPPEESKNLTITVRASCPSNPNETLRGNLVITGSNEFDWRMPLDHGWMPLTAYPFIIFLDSDGEGQTDIPANVVMAKAPLEVAAPHPGRDYLVKISLNLEHFNHTAQISNATVRFRVFYYAPHIEVESVKPITQYSNPSHWDFQYNIYRRTEDIVVKYKQATFRIKYKVRFPYFSFDFYPIIKIELPKTDWEWSPIRRCNSEYTSCLLPKGEPVPSFLPRFVMWYEENQNSYSIYIKSYDEDMVLFEQFEGERGFWFPKPISDTPTVKAEVVGIELLRGGIIWENDTRYEYLPYTTALTPQTFQFYSPVTESRGFRLGFYIVDRGQYTNPQGIVNDFPLAAKRYLEAVFPVEIKEVRFLGYKQSPNDTFQLAVEISEEIAEANVHRAVAIVPDAYSPCPSAIGCVYGGARNVAFVKHSWATDRERYFYLPVVAHELSHTFGYPDIYYGVNFPQDYCWTCTYYGRASDSSSRDSCTGTPYVPGKAAFFDEVNGGLIEILWYIPLKDIMACGDERERWAYHSWWRVYEGTANLDLSQGLLVSIIIYRNGTIAARPFSVIYNHSIPYPPESGTGDVQLQLVSRDGQLLKIYPFNISYEIFDSPAEANLTSIVAVVPWFEDLGEIRLVNIEGETLFSRLVTPHPPELELLYPLDGMKLKTGRNYTVMWRGSDPDGDTLWYNVHIRRRGEESWAILAHRCQGTRLTFQAPGETGEYELMVKATDGVNTAYKLVRVFAVEELPTYEVKASSNVGIPVQGSGTYEEGSNVTVSAPKEAPMPGILGVLGAKYLFQRWTGFIQTRQNVATFIAKSDGKTITVTAIYAENVAQAYATIALIAIAVAAAAIYLAIKIKGK